MPTGSTLAIRPARSSSSTISPVVRCSSWPISGWACRSRRIATRRRLSRRPRGRSRRGGARRGRRQTFAPVCHGRSHRPEPFRSRNQTVIAGARIAEFRLALSSRRMAHGGRRLHYLRRGATAIRLTPNMIRVVFGGADLAAFASSGFADERLGGRPSPVPRRSSPTTPCRAATRCGPGTPRRRELTIDFVRHDGRRRRPVGRSGRARRRGPTERALGWYDTARRLRLAAAGRRHDRPAGPRAGSSRSSRRAAAAHVIVEIIEAADRQKLHRRPTSPSRVARRQRPRPRAQRAGPGRPAASSFPPGPGYVWFAGEAAESRAVRKYLRRELGWPVDRFEILGYWRVRKEEWMARYDQSAPSSSRSTPRRSPTASSTRPSSSTTRPWSRSVSELSPAPGSGRDRVA